MSQQGQQRHNATSEASLSKACFARDIVRLYRSFARLAPSSMMASLNLFKPLLRLPGQCDQGHRNHAGGDD